MKNKKVIKIGIIIAVIVAVIVGIGIGIVHIRDAMYEEAHRYLTYEELEPGQIILVLETHTKFDGEMKVIIQAVDKEGNLYSLLVKQDEWLGIEESMKEIMDGVIMSNYISHDDMKKIYEDIVKIYANADYRRIMKEIPAVEPKPVKKEYYIGIRYRNDGTAEFVTFWEERRFGEVYIMDDPAAEDAYWTAGYPL
ncbi:MAG: hypothetical protein IJ336_02135 [Lachnospiraceae bacterium]|nr:hypothetical protein [Lachnospiraceae bacterium]